MVGGYQLLSLKNYTFHNSDDGTIFNINIDPKDNSMFKELFDTNKPIICKDIVVKFNYSNIIKKYDNIILLKFEYEDETVHGKHLIGLLYDYGDFFTPIGMLKITNSGDSYIMTMAQEGDLG